VKGKERSQRAEKGKLKYLLYRSTSQGRRQGGGAYDEREKEASKWEVDAL